MCHGGVRRLDGEACAGEGGDRGAIVVPLLLGPAASISIAGVVAPPTSNASQMAVLEPGASAVTFKARRCTTCAPAAPCAPPHGTAAVGPPLLTPPPPPPVQTRQPCSDASPRPCCLQPMPGTAALAAPAGAGLKLPVSLGGIGSFAVLALGVGLAVAPATILGGLLHSGAETATAALLECCVYGYILLQVGAADSACRPHDTAARALPPLAAAARARVGCAELASQPLPPPWLWVRAGCWPAGGWQRAAAGDPQPWHCR